jgi:hypothetical protein
MPGRLPVRIREDVSPVRFKAGEDTAAVFAIDHLDPAPEKGSPLDRLREDLIRGGAMTGAAD